MADQMPAESVSRRYLVTIGAQFIQFAAGITTAGVVPRALGPANFGNYNFLLTTAATIRGFLEPSTQQAFFTFSSQERRSGGLTRLYALTLAIQVLISFGFISIVASLGKLDWLWAGQVLDQILLVTILEWIIFVTTSLRQLGDSKGLTVHAQVLSVMASLINVVGLLGLNALGWLSIYSYIAVSMISALLIAWLLIRWLLVGNSELTWAGSLRQRAKEYVGRWWHYAAPLILLEYYTPLVAYVSTYLLQRWYGSIEQGNFAIASKWSALILVFTSSALMIFWREIAHAMANSDHERAANMYQKFSFSLFFLVMVLCMWLSFSSRLLVEILAGEEYTPAISVLAIMAFYPLQQTYGQINTAALKGAEKTKVIRNLGILISIPDLLLTYFLLAPVDAVVPGLNLGALGIAFKMVIYGLISVQAYEWMSHATFELNYFHTLFQKLSTAIVISVCAWVALWSGANFLIDNGISKVFVLGGSSILYFMLIAFALAIRPDLAGLNRSEVYNYLQKGYDTLNALLR